MMSDIGLITEVIERSMGDLTLVFMGMIEKFATIEQLEVRIADDLRIILNKVNSLNAG